MPILYRPLRQYMTPQNEAISATTNDFSLFISGSQCIAYKFSILTMLNGGTTLSDTDRVAITTLYDGDELVIEKDLSSGVSAGNDYKWQIVLYGKDLPFTAIDTSNNNITIANHNLSDGDMVYTNNTVNGLTKFITYYVRKIASDKVQLHTTYESARNGGTPVDITGTFSGTPTISPITISEQIPFSVYASPTLELTSETIDKYYKEFIPVYTQAQSLQPIKFIADLYDGTGLLIKSSDYQYTSNIKYTFDGFVTDITYGVRFRAWNKLNQEADTGIVNFPVSYTSSILQTNPIAINDSENSAIILGLDNLYQSTGVVTPTGESQYMPDFNGFNEDIGLHLNIDASISFTGLTILPDNTFILEWIPDDYSTFDGDIFKLENPYDATQYAIVGYENSLKKFYTKINSETKFYNAEKELVDNQIYLLALVGSNLYTIDFYSYYYGYAEDYPRNKTLMYDDSMNYSEDYVD